MWMLPSVNFLLWVILVLWGALDWRLSLQCCRRMTTRLPLYTALLKHGVSQGSDINNPLHPIDDELVE